jgi:hypothetical protein
MDWVYLSTLLPYPGGTGDFANAGRDSLPSALGERTDALIAEKRRSCIGSDPTQQSPQIPKTRDGISK